MRAFETTATVAGQHELILDQPLQLADRSKVRILILLPDEDIDDNEWLRAASASPAFGFLRDADENIYTSKDGKPFQDKG